MVEKEEKTTENKELLKKARELRDNRKPAEAEQKDKVNPNKLVKKPSVWKNLFKKQQEKKMLLINMTLISGFVEHFYVEIKNESFDFNKGTYIIDLSMVFWDISAKFYALDYYEGFCLPIKRHIDIGKLNTVIMRSNEYDCETATNPSLIRQFMIGNIIEQVIAGARLSKWLQAMRLMILVTLIISAITLIIVFFKLGGIKVA